MEAKVIRDLLVVFTEPRGVHYVCFLKRGDVVTITEGYKYEDRTWREKEFVKVVSKKGEVGFCVVSGLSPIKEKSK